MTSEVAVAVTIVGDVALAALAAPVVTAVVAADVATFCYKVLCLVTV